jgi:hypothetical protein
MRLGIGLLDFRQDQETTNVSDSSPKHRPRGAGVPRDAGRNVWPSPRRKRREMRMMRG